MWIRFWKNRCDQDITRVKVALILTDTILKCQEGVKK